MKYKIVFVIYMLFISLNAMALTVTVDFGNAAINSDTTLINLITTEVENAIGKYDNMPLFAKGMGNANTYAASAATMRGYQGYSIFSIAVGTMAAIQAPSGDPKFYQDMQDDLDNGDLYAGVGCNPVVVQVGLNLSFLVEDLYVAFRFGKFDYEIDAGDFKIDYNSNLIGGLINYQLIKEKSILSRALLWRGISLETGCIYSNNNIAFYKKLDSIYSLSGSTFTADVDPSIDIVLDMTGYIIPVELYTSLRLFYVLNFGVGVGFDYVAAGKTDLSLKSSGEAVITAGGLDGTKGTITVDASTNNVKPDRYRPKYMANVGLSAGPVFIDVPVTYYLDNAFSVGVTAGVVW
jgi:hypothetical protein